MKIFELRPGAKAGPPAEGTFLSTNFECPIDQEYGVPNGVQHVGTGGDSIGKGNLFTPYSYLYGRVGLVGFSDLGADGNTSKPLVLVSFAPDSLSLVIRRVEYASLLPFTVKVLQLRNTH
jgi:hypothetical protein